MWQTFETLTASPADRRVANKGDGTWVVNNGEAWEGDQEEGASGAWMSVEGHFDPHESACIPYRLLFPRMPCIQCWSLS